MSGVPAWGTYLSPIDAEEVVGSALARLLWWKFGRSLDPVDDLSALRAVPTRALDDRGTLCAETCYVRRAQRTYRWDAFSSAADDGDTAILPTDKTTLTPGRWLAVPFREYPNRFQRRFLEGLWLISNDIPPYVSPDLDRPSLLTVCSGKLPALFICPLGRGPVNMTDQMPRQSEQTRLRYRIKAIAANWRGEPAARFGSPVPAEDAEDASVAEIIGRCIWFLRLHAAGLLGTPGVGLVQVGEQLPAGSWGPDLRLMETLDVNVLVTTHVFKEPEEVQQVTRLKVQRQTPEPEGLENFGPVDEVECRP